MLKDEPPNRAEAFDGRSCCAPWQGYVLMREAKIHIADKSRYRSDRRWKCCRFAVKVLWPFLLVILSLAAVSAESLLDVGVAGTKPVGLDAGSSIKREINAGEKNAFVISL